MLDASIIRDILPLGIHAVEVNPHFFYFVIVVLVNDTLGSIMKSLRRFVVPPLVDVAQVIELSTFIVESVCDFVTYDYSDTSVIQAFGEMFVVKWRL